MDIENVNALGRELEERLILRYAPIALKLIYSEDEIPEGTKRPFDDEGDRLAMCQAFALVRRERKAYTMLKDDHWCVWPLVSYKMCPLEEEDYEFMGTKFFVKDPKRGVKFLREEYPMLEGEAPIGFSIAPLAGCNFEPDLVCAYCDPAQMRSFLMAAKYVTGDMLPVVLDPVLVATSGGVLTDWHELLGALDRLLPLSTIVTPSSALMSASKSRTCIVVRESSALVASSHNM